MGDGGGCPALKGLDFFEKVADFLELAVNGGVAHVGDGVEGVEFVHGHGSDEFGADFPFVAGFELVDYGFGGFLKGGDADGTFFAGFEQAVEEFLLIEGLMAPVAFNDSELDALDLLVCGEAGSTIQAFPAAADGGPVAGESGVHHAVIEGGAFGATHCGFNEYGENFCTIYWAVNFFYHLRLKFSLGGSGR